MLYGPSITHRSRRSRPENKTQLPRNAAAELHDAFAWQEGGRRSELLLLVSIFCGFYSSYCYFCC
jgi:hypothetical protein